MGGIPPSIALPLSDAVPLVRWWLGQHPAVTAAFGSSLVNISRWNEPPWPDLVVTDTSAGSDGDLIWLSNPEIQLEAYGDLDGTPGKAALRTLLMTAVGALRELADAPYPYGAGMPDGAPVVTWVQSSVPGGWSPLASGQPRYLAAVRLTVHPAGQG